MGMSDKVNADLIHEWIRSEISGTIIRAHIAAMDGREVVLRFDTSFQHDYPVRVRFLLRLKELCERDPLNMQCARDLMERIEAAVDSLPAPKRRSADGTLAELALLLPQQEQLAYAVESVLHSRRSRRVSGYKIIKRHIGHGSKDALAQSYHKYGDREALVALLVTGEDISDVAEDLEAVIGTLRERYHQALAIERILVRAEQLAFSLAAKFPMAFIWAAGRQRHTAAKPFVVQQLQAMLQEAESATTVQNFVESSIELRVLIWALGRVGAAEYMAELARKYEVTLPWPSSSHA